MSIPAKRLVSPERAAELKTASKDWPSIDLNQEQTGKLEMVLQGILVTENIDLDLTNIESDDIALRNAEGVMLAVWHTSSGEVEGVQLPQHYAYNDLRLSPEEIRAHYGDRPILMAFVSGPLLRQQVMDLLDMAVDREHVILLAAIEHDTASLFDQTTRLRTLRCELKQIPDRESELILLPLLIDSHTKLPDSILRPISKSFGATEYVDLTTPVVSDSLKILREKLERGQDISDKQLYTPVTKILRKVYPPRNQQGFTVFFTGLSGSGKSTIARALVEKLKEAGERKVTLLDGDLVRKNLSSELTFSREHRDLNIRRIGFVANEITKNGGIAVCAPIAPYDAIRREARRLIQPHGGFILVHVATPLSVCEARDRKGLYAKARAGLITEFTGISDPYESPEDAELVLDTTEKSARDAVNDVLALLHNEGFLETMESID